MENLSIEMIVKLGPGKLYVNNSVNFSDIQGHKVSLEDYFKLIALVFCFVKNNNC